MIIPIYVVQAADNTAATFLEIRLGIIETQNPFDFKTRISYFLPEDTAVTLYICDIFGNPEEILINQDFHESGEYLYEFNLPYSWGTFYINLVTKEKVVTKMITLPKNTNY